MSVEVTVVARRDPGVPVRHCQGGESSLPLQYDTASSSFHCIQSSQLAWLFLFVPVRSEITEIYVLTVIHPY